MLFDFCLFQHQNDRVQSWIQLSLGIYLNYVRTDSSSKHFANKVSMMRRFFGEARVEAAGGPAKSLGNTLSKTGGNLAKVLFSGDFVEEITATLV